MNKKFILLASAALLAMPVVSLAGWTFTPPDPPTSFAYTAEFLITSAFLYIIWPIVAAFIVIMFIIAGFKFLMAQGSPDKIAEARTFVIYGVVGIAVILLSWSIMFMIQLALGVF